MSNKWSVLFFVAAMACGGSEFSLGLPRDKQIKDLTTEDLQQSCRVSRAALKSTDAAIRGYCATILSPDGVDSCNKSLHACVERQKHLLEVAQDFDCEKVVRLPAHADCVVTVGDYEDCYASLIDAIHIMEAATCENPAQPPMMSAQASCSLISSVCPGLAP